MLTESEKFIKDPNGEIKANGDVYLYGKEINDETYAICKSDMMIKGDNPENIKNGSTLATDEFRGETFDFMLSNPPYGKSWSSDMPYIKDGKEVIDPRFRVKLTNYWGEVEEVDAVPRSSDGQLLFLMEMVDKMKPLSLSPLGSRIASVHNGSSLFTGDAGSGESNIRRYIIENDMLEAIIQLPNNLFYNTGITTYIWILSNNKSEHRKGKVQLIDANKLYKKLRKNLGDKNCELTPEHIKEITQIFLDMKEVEKEKISSKIFNNSDFGYYKVNIERPKRLKAQFTQEKIETLIYDKNLLEPMKWAYEKFGDRVYSEIDTIKDEIFKWYEDEGIELKTKQKKSLSSATFWQKYLNIYNTAQILMQEIGSEIFDDFNIFKQKVEKSLKDKKIKLTASEKNLIYSTVSWYDEDAKKVIKKIHKFKDEELEKLLNHLKCKKEDLADFGYYPTDKEQEFIEYESESELRDSENIPLNQNIHDYFLKEVKPYVNDAWIDIDSVKIGYEISFNRYFYKHKPLRSIEEVSKEILELEKESEGLLKEILELSNE